MSTTPDGHVGVRTERKQNTNASTQDKALGPGSASAEFRTADMQTQQAQASQPDVAGGADSAEPNDRDAGAAAQSDGGGEREQLDATVDRVKGLLASAAKNDTTTRYEVAREVRGIVDAKRHKKGVIKNFADAVGLKVKTIYAYANVARAWTPEAFSSLSGKLSAKTHLPLTWSQYLELAQPSFDAVRDEAVEQTLRDNLTVREIRQLLTEGRTQSKQRRTQPAQNSDTVPEAELLARCHDLLASLDTLDMEIKSGRKHEPQTARAFSAAFLRLKDRLETLVPLLEEAAALDAR